MNTLVSADKDNPSSQHELSNDPKETTREFFISYAGTEKAFCLPHILDTNNKDKLQRMESLRFALNSGEGLPLSLPSSNMVVL